MANKTISQITSELTDLTSDGYYVEVDHASAGTKKAKLNNIRTTDGVSPVVTGYIFNGSNNVMLDNNSNLNFGTGNFSIEGYIKTGSQVTSKELIISKKGTSGLGDGFRIYIAAGKLYAGIISSSAEGNAPIGDVDTDSVYYFVANFDRENNVLGGYLKTVPSSNVDISSFTNSVSNTAPVYIGMLTGGSAYFSGEVYFIRANNRILSESEVNDFWNNGEPTKVSIPFEHQGASNDELVTNGDFANWTADDPDNWNVSAEDANNYVTESSGAARFVSDGNYFEMNQIIASLELGKEYKIEFDATVTSGSLQVGFTSSDVDKIGTVNSTKHYILYAIPSSTSGILRISFKRVTACDITLDNISIKDAGNVLNLEGSNAGQNGWVGELGGFPVIGNTSGTPISLGDAMNGMSGITGAVTLYNAVPKDRTLVKAIVYNNQATARYINIGTTSGGTDVASNIAIAASDYTLISLNKYFSGSDRTTLYISVGTSDGGGAMDLDLRMYFED